MPGYKRRKGIWAACKSLAACDTIKKDEAFPPEGEKPGKEAGKENHTGDGHEAEEPCNGVPALPEFPDGGSGNGADAHKQFDSGADLCGSDAGKPDADSNPLGVWEKARIIARLPEGGSGR